MTPIGTWMTQHLLVTNSVLISPIVHIQSASKIIFAAGIVGLVWAYIQFRMIQRIKIVSQSGAGETQPLTGGGDDEKTARLNEIYGVIYEGAESFLQAEYIVCGWFVGVFSIVIFILVSWGTGWDLARGFFTALSFLLGALTSMVRACLLVWSDLLGHSDTVKVSHETILVLVVFL